jgi:transposase-like protein
MSVPVRRAVSVFDRPRWSEEEAREVLEALERSGQSVGAFAADHDLDPQRLYCWRRRLGVCAEATTFEELVVRAPAARGAADSSRFEILLRSGTVVRVPAGFDAEALASLLTVVASVAC